MAFMLFNVPYTYFGFWFSYAKYVYLIVGGALLLIYCIGWVIFRKSKSILKAVWLSVTPAALFLFCGITLSNIPLIVFSIIFATAHVTLSCKNALPENKKV